ncbi:MAG: amidohydrolase family protein, partial [Desulfobacterales bacterium]|nr:amidohydrolase family protein [Desulfobacterales bacterium]
RVLGYYCRERRLFELPEAVRKMTSMPADQIGLADRGRIAVGKRADLVVFDPATIGASKLRRIYDLPAGADRLVSDAIGVEAVVVNGTVIRRAGVDAVDPQGVLPGRLLRGGHASV